MIHASYLIKSFEGCRLLAYQDGGGRWTIGWGHTASVCESMVITQPQADTFLLADLVEFETYVNHYVTVSLTQHQFDALVSFTYNLGPGTLQHSDLLSFVNAGRILQAADAFLEYDHDNGVQVAGLTRRRQAERTLFLTSNQVPDWVDRIVSWFRK